MRATTAAIKGPSVVKTWPDFPIVSGATLAKCITAVGLYKNGVGFSF
jgi:hypothetical protein